MNSDLDKFDAKLSEHFSTTNRYDEKLFNLGVQLGRILEKNNLEDYRPKVFIEFENSENIYSLKLAEYRRIDSALEFLLRNALAKQIEEYGPFTFDNNSWSSSRDAIADEIVNEFYVQVGRTTQQEHGGSFEVDLVFSGQVAEIFAKHEISSHGRADVDNSTGDEHETIYDPDDVKKVFGVSVNLHLGSHSEEQLKEIAGELEKITTWMKLKLKKVR